MAIVAAHRIRDPQAHMQCRCRFYIDRPIHSNGSIISISGANVNEVIIDRHAKVNLFSQRPSVRNTEPRCIQRG